MAVYRDSQKPKPRLTDAGMGDSMDLIKVLPAPHGGAMRHPSNSHSHTATADEAWHGNELGSFARSGSLTAKQMRGRPNTSHKPATTGWGGSMSSTKSTSRQDGTGCNAMQISSKPITGHTMWGSRGSGR